MSAIPSQPPPAIKPTLRDLRAKYQVSEPHLPRRVIPPKPEPPKPPPRNNPPSSSNTTTEEATPDIPVTGFGGSLGRATGQRMTRTALGSHKLPPVATLFDAGNGNGISSHSDEAPIPTRGDIEDASAGSLISSSEGRGYDISTIGPSNPRNRVPTARIAPKIGHAPRGLRPISKEEVQKVANWRADRHPQRRDPKLTAVDFGWTIYDAVREYQRLGLDGVNGNSEGKWRISAANQGYQLCPSYPA